MAWFMDLEGNPELTLVFLDHFLKTFFKKFYPLKLVWLEVKLHKCFSSFLYEVIFVSWSRRKFERLTRFFFIFFSQFHSLTLG